jgi:putative transposase
LLDLRHGSEAAPVPARRELQWFHSRGVLAKAQDIHVSQKRIARLMRQERLRARPRKRFKCTTMSDHDQPVAASLLARNFEAIAPNQKWVGDTTELLTGDDKLFLAVILDLFSKFVVGWALSPVNDRHLTIDALEMAIKRRCPEVGLLHHSDQGCTYASEDYQKILAERGVVCSMSRRGNPYDNAVIHRLREPAEFETTFTVRKAA